VPPRLLLVDDEPRIVDKLALLLQREGFEAQVAYNGRQAVDAALSSHPDVFILDIGMPDVDGYKLARQLRTTMNCEGKVFIALSGYSDQKHLDQASNSGFDEYLVKPCDLGMLLAILSDVSRRAGQ
jgi:DNA-binding response OmpR family regulator